MSSESAEFNTPGEILTPNGDVVLVVGHEGMRLQIASEFLTLASPVFDAMLNLKFSEGIKLHERDKSPVDIKLPEDDGQKVSIVVDKYDMSARFAMAGTVWMDCDPINLEDAWKLMTASYWLDHQVGFRRMSEYVIGKLNHAQIFRLANETFDVALGLKLGMALLLLHHALSQVMVHPKGGLCLPCFKIAVEDPVGMQPGCPCPSNHRSG
ncbi:hypothetical protein H9Q73_004410 [Fusarium xylarioides]|nr:hypothetical protein H9Q73_004410 [Fusarium xylarioides]